MDRHDGTNARGLESAEIEAMRTQRDRAEEKARRLEAEIVEWKDAAMFVCAPVVYGGHLRPSEVREEVASLRRHLAVKREQYESRARVCDELRAELEAVRRERDEWKARHDTLADVSRKCIATAERERDEARAERDARPDISAEDALLMEDARATLELPAYEHGPEHQDAAMRIARAIRAHAAKVKP